MNIAIVFDSHTNKTAAMATEMRKVLETRGHTVSLRSVKGADPAESAQADLLLLGCPTHGLFLILQHPSKEWQAWVDRLPQDMKGTRVALFTSYLLRVGPALQKMEAPLRQRNARIVSRFKARGSALPGGFGEWAAGL